MKWRLMTHAELEHAYKDDGVYACYPNRAYLTFASEDDPDPLYSIDICNGDNEEHNTNLALLIINNALNEREV
jgi:hypothetical protein